MSVTKEDFISKWQELHLEGYHLLNNDSQQIDDKCRVEKHVDVIRNTLSHLQFAKLCGIVSTTCANHLFLKYADVYGTLIDSSVTDSGLDNFAEIVLSQNEGRLNESQQWKSSLTLPEISEKSYVKEVTEQSLLTPDATLPTKHSIEISQQEVGVSSTVLSSGYQPAANISVAKPVITSTDIQNQTKHALFDGNRCTDRSQGIWGSTCSTKGFKDVQNSGPNVQYPVSESGCANTSVKYGNQKVPVQASKRAWNASDDTSAEGGQSSEASAFRTAKEQLIINEKKLYRGSQASAFNYGTNKKSLGTRRGLNSKFVPPVINKDVENNEDSVARRLSTAVLGKKPAGTSHVEKTVMDERLKNLDPKMIELITNEIMDHGPPVTWNDVAGLEFAKKTIKEIVVWPMLRPDIFTGLRGPPKGLLLFGPPGTGKTLIGKCIASQSKSTFFSISASSLTSKWVGEGEKMVRVLFGVARVHQPAVIFIDEIDSLLSRRTDGEHEGSRRIKTEFLIQLEGATTAADDRILVVGATNRPQEIDEAARRRFVKRLYIPLPDTAARKQIVMNLMSQQHHSLTEEDVESICLKSDGYSGSDVANLCREAALGPIRSMRFEDIENIEADQVRPIAYQDFMDAFKQVRASVSQKDLNIYIDWNKEYGSWPVE